MNIIDKSTDILNQIYDIYSLSTCLQNSINYDFDNCNNINSYNLILLKIIDDKFKNLITDYDKFDLLLFNL